MLLLAVTILAMSVWQQIDFEQQKQELKGIVSGHKNNMPDDQKRELILDEVIYPLLNSFKSVLKRF